jgi:hypothetical protein
VRVCALVLDQLCTLGLIDVRVPALFCEPVARSFLLEGPSSVGSGSGFGAPEPRTGTVPPLRPHLLGAQLEAPRHRDTRDTGEGAGAGHGPSPWSPQAGWRHVDPALSTLPHAAALVELPLAGPGDGARPGDGAGVGGAEDDLAALLAQERELESWLAAHQDTLPSVAVAAALRRRLSALP